MVHVLGGGEVAEFALADLLAGDAALGQPTRPGPARGVLAGPRTELDGSTGRVAVDAAWSFVPPRPDAITAHADEVRASTQPREDTGP